jgi:hypothetical protein
MFNRIPSEKIPPNGKRTSINATTWPATTPGGPPLYVPANTKVVYTVFLMHRRKDLWGPDGILDNYASCTLLTGFST